MDVGSAAMVAFVEAVQVRWAGNCVAPAGAPPPEAEGFCGRLFAHDSRNLKTKQRVHDGDVHFCWCFGPDFMALGRLSLWVSFLHQQNGGKQRTPNSKQLPHAAHYAHLRRQNAANNAHRTASSSLTQHVA
jgi:hypothetical protein